MSFRFKTIIGVALIEGCLLLSLVWSSLGYLQRSNEDELTLRARVSAESIANLARDAVLAADLARLDSVTARTARAPEILYVRIIDLGRKQVLSQAGDANVLARPFVQDTHLDDAHDGVFDVGVDIVEADYVFGRVELGVSVARVNQLVSDARQYLTGLALVAMLLVALFSYVLGSYLTRGLHGLTQAASAISTGALGALVEVRGTDELAVTGKAFNKMSVRLAESQREMQRNVKASEALSVQLAEKEQRLTTILDTAVDGFVTIDERGIIDGINAAGAALFGYRVEELVGRNVSCLMPEPDRSAHDGYLQRYLVQGEARIIGHGRRVAGLRKDGSTFPMDLAVSEMTIGSERMFVGLVRDLSKQLQAEAVARKSDAMRAAIVDANLDALVTIDAQDRIVEFSGVAEKIFGYRREAIMGKRMAALLIPPQMREQHAQGMRKYLASGDGPVIGNRIEVQALRANGESFPVELTVQAVNVAGEQLFTAMIRDISDRKAEEQALRDARDRAELASQAKSRFLAHMSHEIRSPLNAVLGSLGLLLDDDLSKDQRLYAKTAEASGKSLLSLINDILDFSKIEAGRVTLSSRGFAVRDLVNTTMDLVAFKARDKGVYVAAQVEPAVVARVLGDESRVRQILTNLLDNALKFTDAGSVILTVEMPNANFDGVQLRFSVEDSGIGIAHDAQAGLFDEFAQVDNSSTTRHGGSGLGLSICQGLANLMGATIGLHSEPGKGSRFWLDIPFAPDPASEAGQAVVLALRQALVVGFPAQFAHALQQMFAGAGCSVVFADNAQQACSALDCLPQVLLVDAQLESDELEAVAQRARAAGVQRVLLLAAAASSPALQRVASGQYDDLLLSPLTMDALLESLQPVPMRDELRTGVQSGEESAPGPVAHSARILLAEDSVANQLVATAILRKQGCTVEVANNGREAVEMFAAGGHDLILMDMRMPKMDGLQATAAIRALPGGERIPIIAMTANVMQQDVDRCLAAGMDDFEPKPVNRVRLLKTLARHLSARALQAGLRAGEWPQVDDASGYLDEPLVDEDAIRRLSEDVGDQAVPAMLVTFIDETSMRVSNLIKAQSERAMQLVEDEAHTLKSCAGTFGAVRLQALARDIEVACQTGNWRIIENLAANMAEVLRQTQLAYRQHVDFLSDTISKEQHEEPVRVDDS